MPRRLHRPPIAAALVLVGACARSPAPTATPTTDAAVAEPAATARPWTTTILPASTSERTIVAGPSTYRVLEGRRRLASTDGKSEVIADIPGAKFVAYDAASDGTTVFVDELGSIYRAPSFTGRLTAVPTNGARWRSVAVTDEHAFVCAADGTLGRVPVRGEARFEQLRQECASKLDPPLIAKHEVLFLVDDDHRLLRSQDGERFTPVEIGGAEIVELNVYRGAWARTATGLLQLHADGTATPADPAAPAEPIPGLPSMDERDAAIRALERGHDEHYGDSWAIGWAYRASDERFWRCSSSDCAAIGSAAPHHAIEGRCELQREGATMVALCRSELATDGSGELSIHQLGAAGWALRARMPWPDAVLDEPHELDFVVGDDGAVLLAAPCRAAEYPDIAIGMCWLDRDTWRAVEESEALGAYNGSDTRLVTLRDRWLVAEAPEGEFVRIDLSTGASEALASPRGPVVVDPVFRDDALLLTIGGGAQLVVLVREGDRERRVLVPRGATSIAFASATRFLAAGATADRLWTTIDGGATWTVLDVPVEGDPRAVALDQAFCTNAACTAAPVAWVDPALLAVLDHRPPKLVARPR